MPENFVGILSGVGALLAPWLIYLASRHRLAVDRRKATSEDDAAVWARMTSLLDRYTLRIEKLELRLEVTEEKAIGLFDQLERLRRTMRRWREYALALVRQLEGASLTPIDPAQSGLGPEDYE